MPPQKPRSELELRKLIDAAIKTRVEEALRGHDHKHRKGSWLATVFGIACVGAGIYIFLTAHHSHSEWVSIVLIILGGALFDGKVVTGLLRARFGNGRNRSESGVTGEQETGGA
jgi:hypothetical protein